MICIAKQPTTDDERDRHIKRIIQVSCDAWVDRIRSHYSAELRRQRVKMFLYGWSFGWAAACLAIALLNLMK